MCILANVHSSLRKCLIPKKFYQELAIIAEVVMSSDSISDEKVTNLQHLLKYRIISNGYENLEC